MAACRWVKLACARHLRDLQEGHARGLWWDADVVEDVRLFFSGLRHSKGEWAGRPIALEPWQFFVFGSSLAWKRADGTRRFRIAYVEVPRANGKSTIAAGLGLYLAFFDDEPGAEVYAAATKRDQAKIVWAEAKRMVLRAPRLRERITPLVANLSDQATASKFEPLGADADNLDGLRIHGAIVDELHAHKTRAMWDVLETAIGARRQPLIFAITTAGSNRAGVCYEQRLYVTKLLEGLLEDDTVFGVIYTIDEGDDWTTPASWAKANPNLGVSVKIEDLAARCKKAQAQPSAQPAFLTKHLDVWVNADNPWLAAETWASGARSTPPDLAGARCWLGLDLATKVDIAARADLFQLRGGTYYARFRFYLPAESVHASGHAETAHYEGWARAGHVVLTEGPSTDLERIQDEVLAEAGALAPLAVGFDPWQAQQLANHLLAEGVPMVEIRPSVQNFSEPMKSVEQLLLQGKLAHDGNPAMAWMVSNVVCHTDAKDNIYPRKAHPALKIDGVVALLSAMSRALLHPATGGWRPL